MKFRLIIPALAISLLPACAQQAPQESASFCAGSIPIVSASAPEVKPAPKRATVKKTRKARKRSYYRKRPTTRKQVKRQVTQKPEAAPIPPIPLPLEPIPPLEPPRLQ